MSIKGSHVLWYQNPSRAWEEALPVGNGRLGGMVFGDGKNERIALNEDSLWAGYPRKNMVMAAEYYPKVQKLALEGRYHEAQSIIEQHMEGNYTQSYLPAGDLLVEYLDDGEISGYKRSLDMSRAEAVTIFSRNSTNYTASCFASKPDETLVFAVKGDKPGAVNIKISLSCQLKSEIKAQGDMIELTGIAPSHTAPSYIREIPDEQAVTYFDDDIRKGMRFCMVALAEAKNGEISVKDGSIIIKNADEAVVKLCIRTSFNGFDKSAYLNGIDEKAACYGDVNAIKNKSLSDIYDGHIADFMPLFNRIDFHLGRDEEAELPTDILLKNAEERGGSAIVELLFHYGRYLMLTASRPGTQATNLQGIWNKDLRPAWSSNFTININTEMNYWPAEPMGMGDMHQPLFDLIEKLMVTGAQSAEDFYGAKGAVSHHNTDLWGLSNVVGENRPRSAGHAFWPMSFGWLCRHMYEHYEYTLDKDFLKNRAYPAIKMACEFYLDVMVKNKNGHYIITPATSPENAFTHEGKTCHVAQSATMSNLIMRECFENLLKCAEILGIDDDILEKVRESLPLIMPCEIGSKGQLLEWNEEFIEPEPHHRHVSHLYGLYPGDMTGYFNAPKLAQACKRTLELRGDDGTGWSLGWKVNLWARLLDGDHALKLLCRQLRYVPADEEREQMGGGGTYMNLFDAHPPFQIDGNFSACSGIGEMLLQCVDGRVILLPALPKSWTEGAIKGIRAKGGYSFDIEFDGGKLKTASATAIIENPSEITVSFDGKNIRLKLEKGETAIIK